MLIAQAMCRLMHVTVAALCSSCSLQQYLEWWPASLNEAGPSVLMLMKGSKILRVELNTVHLYQHYWLFMHDKLQYNWRGDYCQCVWPAQLPIQTEVWASSLLEQRPWYIPHGDHAGYNKVSWWWTLVLILFDSSGTAWQWADTSIGRKHKSMLYLRAVTLTDGKGRCCYLCSQFLFSFTKHQSLLTVLCPTDCAYTTCSLALPLYLIRRLINSTYSLNKCNWNHQTNWGCPWKMLTEKVPNTLNLFVE